MFQPEVSTTSGSEFFAIAPTDNQTDIAMLLLNQIITEPPSQWTTLFVEQPRLHWVCQIQDKTVMILAVNCNRLLLNLIVSDRLGTPPSSESEGMSEALGNWRCQIHGKNVGVRHLAGDQRDKMNSSGETRRTLNLNLNSS